MRTPLPQRRQSLNFALAWPPTSFRPQVVDVSCGFHADGAVGDVFVTAGKSGDQLEGAARDSAILLSLALQHGTALETIRHAITRDETGAPASLIGAVIDAIPLTTAQVQP